MEIWIICFFFNGLTFRFFIFFLFLKLFFLFVDISLVLRLCIMPDEVSPDALSDEALFYDEVIIQLCKLLGFLSLSSV